jgi:hypothetical protein
MSGEQTEPKTGGPVSGTASTTPDPVEAKPKQFIGTVEVSAAMARARLLEIEEEVIRLLSADPRATISVRVEISAEFPDGAADGLRRAVSENATALKFRLATWEE